MPRRRLTVVFATNGLAVGGIETNIVRLTRELTSRGHRVLVATSGGPLEDSLTAAGGIHIQCPLMHPSFADLWSAARTLRRAIVEERPDVIHVMSAPAGVAAWLATIRERLLLRRGRPTIVSSVLGLKGSPDEPIGKTAMRVYLTALGSRRTLVVAPTLRRFFRWLPVRRGRLVQMQVVGVDLPSSVNRAQARKELGSELGLPPHDQIVSTMGALTPRKSHELFVRAAAEVNRTHQDVSFLIIGEGPLRGSLEDEAASLGLASKLHLPGVRNDLTRVLAASDVYVRPGIVEGGVGTTVMHSQALEVPVISFDIADVRTAIEPGKTGLLVPLGDVSALAQAIGRLLANPQLGATIATVGRRSVERFRTARVVDGLEALYAQLAPGVSGMKGQNETL